MLRAVALALLGAGPAEALVAAAVVQDEGGAGRQPGEGGHGLQAEGLLADVEGQA